MHKKTKLKVLIKALELFDIERDTLRMKRRNGLCDLISEAAIELGYREEMLDPKNFGIIRPSKRDIQIFWWPRNKVGFIARREALCKAIVKLQDQVIPPLSNEPCHDGTERRID